MIYPVIFPTLPPARGESLLPCSVLPTGCSRSGKKKAYAAAGLAVVLLFFANPVFHVDSAR